MTYGEAVRDSGTKLGRMAAESRAERDAAIKALMAQGLSLEQAAEEWARSLFA